MKIKAVANGNVIEAHPDAAKQLIEAGIYEAVDGSPSDNSVQPETETKKTTRRRKKA